MTEKTITIPAIACGHCVATIRRELLDIDGVTEVAGDPATRRVTVHYGDPADWDDIAGVLADIGYPPED